jgi:hypothetical protein
MVKNLTLKSYQKMHFPVFAKANQAAGLANKKGGKMTFFSFCCKASPCPVKDHHCYRKTKTTAETATKMAKMATTARYCTGDPGTP